MSDLREATRLIVRSISQRNLFNKSWEWLTDPEWNEFFPRLYFSGVFFLVLSTVGLAIEYLLLKSFGDVSTFTGFISHLIDLLGPLGIILVIAAIVIKFTVTGAIEGEVPFSISVMKPIEDWLTSHSVLTGTINYTLGITVIAISLAYRESIRNLSLAQNFEQEPLVSFLTSILILLLEFGYIGMMLSGIGQTYEGFRLLRSN